MTLRNRLYGSAFGGEESPGTVVDRSCHKTTGRKSRESATEIYRFTVRSTVSS